MADEDVARSLEQEAIALVSLSNPNKFASAVETETETETETPEQEQEQDELLDANISMKSLLVTLKKRKLQHPAEPAPQQVKQEPADETVATDDAKLPSFRAVFQPQPQQPETPVDERADVPPELKCKYRTGKCHNARALKSCGDYHNLCNYHRLRANANQRKLDRKKKEQRLQQQLTADALAGASSPRALQQQQLSHASSHAAAAALASLVAAQPQRHLDALQQRPFFASGVTVQEAAKTNRNRSVRPKQEDACSY